MQFARAVDQKFNFEFYSKLIVCIAERAIVPFVYFDSRHADADGAWQQGSCVAVVTDAILLTEQKRN